MDLQAVRNELAPHAPAGWQVYSHLPGDASLPALVVGLPDRVTFDGSLRHNKAEFSVMLLVPDRYEGSDERKLLDAVGSVAAAYQTLTGESFHGRPQVTVVDQFFSVTVGKTAALHARINLTVLVSN